MGLVDSSTNAWLAVGFCTFASLDLFWFARLAFTKLASFVSAPIDVKSGEEGVIRSIVAPTDIDYFFHMNNGRYHREMDFGRFDFYFRSGLSKFLQSNRIDVVQHASLIRYRRSMDFLVPYRLHTRLVWFDDRSLYFEQRFVTVHDDFVRAVAICKNTAVKCDVRAMMRRELDLGEMECPEEVKKFLEANEISSEKLKRESGRSTKDVVVITSNGGDVNVATESKKDS